MFLFLKTKKSKNLYRDALLSLSKQIMETIKHGVWTNEAKINTSIKQVVVNGMGGSNLGAEIVKSIFNKNLTLPIIIEPGYEVASYVNKETAYIVSSYSGTTEEPIVAYTKAKQRGAQIICLTSTGDNALALLAKKNNTPLFQFPIKANVSNQPRLGLGAALTGMIMVLIKLGALKKTILKEIILSSKKLAKVGNALAHSMNNPARLMANKIKGHEIILVSGPLLAGNMKTLRNQFCESAKNLASYLTVPDMNHFALEGLKYPKNNSKRLIAVFFESNLDSPKIKTRLHLTKEMYKKNKIKVISHELKSKGSLDQSLELLQFGGFLSYYLSIMNHVNPMIVPWVDWFKKELATK